jgi:hypothetical protein
MTAFHGVGPPARGPDDLQPDFGEAGLFARIEGLIGEERALLRVPERDRDQGQRDRLGAIGAELDRIFDALRERAARLATPR